MRGVRVGDRDWSGGRMKAWRLGTGLGLAVIAATVNDCGWGTGEALNCL